MISLKGKHVLVAGLGGRGAAACDLLLSEGAVVLGVDSADNAPLRCEAERLRGIGIQVQLGVDCLPEGDFALVVVSPAVSLGSALVRSAVERKIPVISELELGLQQSRCMSIVVSGTNGKASTAALVHGILNAGHRKAIVAGHRARPLCSVVEQTRELDYLIVQASAVQLASSSSLRSSVAVLLNAAADYPESFAGSDQLLNAYSNLFRNQQAFDWAVIQSETAARFRALNLPLTGKMITFSAADTAADLYMDRGLVLSRLPDWEGPLLNLDQVHLQGAHNAENVMATLAVGRVLRLTLETMLQPLKTAQSLPHCFQPLGEVNGVRFINDSKSTNLEALRQALMSVSVTPGQVPNVWLIAGGLEKGQTFHDLGPLLARRVKGVFLIGQASERMRAAWSLFTPCTLASSLIEATAEAAKNAISGDIVLLSPACSSFDQFRDYKNRGEIFCEAVKSIPWGGSNDHPNRFGAMTF